MKEKSSTTSCILEGQGKRERLGAKLVLAAVIALLLAACSSGLEEELPELATAASTKTTESRISSDRDDAEERSSGLVITSSTDIELTHDVLRGQQYIGLRFNNVNVPRGADIKEAYIQFKADETDSGSVKVRIHAHDTDDAPSFSQGYNEGISKRSKTSASKSWSIASWNERGERSSKQRTPDLNDVIEEVTDRKGWNYGNSMAFMISSSDKNDRRVAESYRGDAKGAPTLVVKHSGGDTSASRSKPVSSGPSVSKGSADWYVSPSGSDSNSGRSKDKPVRTLLKIAREVKPGDVVFLRGGTYKGEGRSYIQWTNQAFTTDGRKGSPITIMSYPGERAIIDGGDISYKRYKSVSSPILFPIKADYYVIQDLTFRNGAGRALFISGDHNTVKNVKSYDNHSDGVYVKGSYNRVENVESYNNYSKQNGGDSADGIKVTSGKGNFIKNCRVYNNSDDGVDIWNSKQTRVENCVSSGNGRGGTGNGVGFKVGAGGSKNTGNVIINNEAEKNRVNFSTNNSTGVELRNNVSRNARSVGFVIDKGNEACGNKSYDRNNYVKYNSGCGNKW